MLRLFFVITSLVLAIPSERGSEPYDPMIATANVLPTGEVPAKRVDRERIRAEQVQAEQVGLNGLPFAPEGLTGCDEFDFYRQQFGLPQRFQGIAWRESNCRNEESVHTSCCWGVLQLSVTLHLRSGLADEYAACGVDSRDDMDSDTPIEWQRSVCAAAALFHQEGYAPWAQTA